jgi:hypothetical protein
MRAFGDSQLVVQQLLDKYQCLNDTLNGSLKKKYQDISRSFIEFDIRHVYQC